ncbi:hypothetical protein, partial [Aeromonas caviae]|uniref:hypothetical protein n=1 Tax=Aeromonas caviae TaxID=648 RepID=UPI0038D16B32
GGSLGHHALSILDRKVPHHLTQAIHFNLTCVSKRATLSPPLPSGGDFFISCPRPWFVISDALPGYSLSR